MADFECQADAQQEISVSQKPIILRTCYPSLWVTRLALSLLSTKRSTNGQAVQLINDLELVYAVWRAGWSFQRPKQISSVCPLWVISEPFEQY